MPRIKTVARQFITWRFEQFSSGGVLRTFLTGILPDDYINEILEDYDAWVNNQETNKCLKNLLLK